TRLEQSTAGIQDYEVVGDSEANGKKSHFKLFYRKPDLVRIDTEDGQVSVQPNGDVRGRLGHGPFGAISRKIDRDDRRLRDSEGIAFWESHFPAAVARMRAQLKAGASATLRVDADTYTLELRNGDTSWRYVIDKATLFPRENSRTVNGKQVEITRYSNLKLNTGIPVGHFKF